MTFTRLTTTPVTLLAFKSKTTEGDLGIQINVGVTTVRLSQEDALALAGYIYEQFPDAATEVSN